jgi:hypothetical protein
MTEIDRDELGNALAWIREEYGDTYPEWCRFAADADSVRMDLDGGSRRFQDPEVHFPLVRWRKPYGVDELRRLVDDETEPMQEYHLRALIELHHRETATRSKV